MRIILFYSGVESFNYFTDEVCKELTKRGHETFIWDIHGDVIDKEQSFNEMLEFSGKGTKQQGPLIAYEDRKYKLLFCGTYYKPEGYLPDRVNMLLDNNELAMGIAENGSVKVEKQFVWKNIVDRIMEATVKIN